MASHGLQYQVANLLRYRELGGRDRGHLGVLVGLRGVDGDFSRIFVASIGRIRCDMASTLPCTYPVGSSLKNFNFSSSLKLRISELHPRWRFFEFSPFSFQGIVFSLVLAGNLLDCLRQPDRLPLPCLPSRQRPSRPRPASSNSKRFPLLLVRGAFE